jgi:hypothetical protein
MGKKLLKSVLTISQNLQTYCSTGTRLSEETYKEPTVLKGFKKLPEFPVENENL